MAEIPPPSAKSAKKPGLIKKPVSLKDKGAPQTRKLPHELGKEPEPAKKRPLNFWKFLHDDGVIDAPVPNEGAEVKRRRQLMQVIHYQNIVITSLIAVLLLGVPFFQPTYEHYSSNPEQQKDWLVPLDEPNLTNEAVLSWVTTAITEVMTLGFGDFDRQILSQKNRFTKKGWDSFLDALQKDNMRDAFKERQLVLTTVPADAPVITGQGADETGTYVWQVELPIIMTYTTNNNMTRRARSIIALTVTRVPVNENEGGMAIKKWHVGGSG